MSKRKAEFDIPTKEIKRPKTSGSGTLSAIKQPHVLRLQEIDFHHWINMTCKKVAKNGPDLKKLAQKKSNWQKWWQKPEDHWSCIAHLSAEDMLN